MRTHLFTAGWIAVIVIPILFLVVSIFGGVNTQPGNGEKIGQIVKLSVDGIAFKTVEGELIRGGFTDGSGTVGSQAFHFTIDKSHTELVEAARDAMRNQKEVVIFYRTKFLYLHMNSGKGGGTFVTAIKPAPKP